MSAKLVLWSVVVLLAAPYLATADTIMSFTPSPADLGDLDHHRVYEWGIDVPLAPGEYAIAAELTFDNIRNWDDNPNVLYNHLLDWAELGVTQGYDNQGGGDFFVTTYVGEASHLVTYENLPSTPQDLTYTFTADDLVVLNNYLADGRVGIGIDPDCHFCNDGVELTITTPEPGMLAFMALGGLLLRRRCLRP